MEKKIPKSVLAVMFVSVLSVCQTVPANELAKKEQWEYASTTPDGKYPELVTYTLGKMTGANNSNLPKGETYENNAYTRYLREYFNIQNKDVFEEKDDQYNVSVSVAMSSYNLPDLMLVGSIEDLRQLVALDLIEDLTKSYENCLTDRIKDIYASYGEGIIDGVTFDGKIMAIPETNIDDGPNLLWLRRDWMDKLGLESPKTIEDAETIVQAFIEKDPGENGEGKTVGFVCDPELSGECGYSSEYLMDIVFAANGAYPKQWIEDENGEVSYGSVLPQAKDALAKLRSMYERNILDQNFLLRTSVNNIELITKGLCGSFFGPWWAANNPLMEAIAANPDAVWEPFLIQTDGDGSTSYYSQNPTYKYVVVRKGYEHPEIACKIINGLFDYVRYDGTYNSEFEEYYQNNVDPTARPLAINVDYSYALTKCYHELTDVLSGKKEPEDLDLLEYSYYRSCKAYLDNTDSATPEEWAAYTSRITACSLLADAKTNKVESLYFDETETMGTQWWKLRKMEKEYYLQIVTGERDIDAFDEFVTKWYENGGETITQEVFLKPAAKTKQKTKRSIITAVFGVFFCNVLLIFLAVRTLGKTLTTQSAWPVIKMMQLIRMSGGFLERFDILPAIVWVFCMMAVISGYLYYGKKMLEQLLLKKSKKPILKETIVTGISVLCLLFLACLVEKQPYLWNSYLKYKIFVDVPLALLLPVFVYIAGRKNTNPSHDLFLLSLISGGF